MTRSAIPTFTAVMVPLLRQLESEPMRVGDIVQAISEAFELDNEARQNTNASGQTTIYNRTNWAITYLAKANLVERPQRGLCQLTPKGRQLLSTNPSELTIAQIRALTPTAEEYQANAPLYSGVGTQEETPEDQIASALEAIEQELAEEVLSRIRTEQPIFFERLVVKLMVAMGYGAAGRAEHVGRSHDGGVDGIISDDPLGLDIVCLQAKRYAEDNSIGVDQIRAFVGSLEERGASKGVFVSTSRFAKPARDYANAVQKRIILVDGAELARLCIRYGVGVQVQRTVNISRIDENFFSEE